MFVFIQYDRYKKYTIIKSHTRLIPAIDLINFEVFNFYTNVIKNTEYLS